MRYSRTYSIWSGHKRGYVKNVVVNFRKLTGLTRFQRLFIRKGLADRALHDAIRNRKFEPSHHKDGIEIGAESAAERLCLSIGAFSMMGIFPYWFHIIQRNRTFLFTCPHYS